MSAPRTRLGSLAEDCVRSPEREDCADARHYQRRPCAPIILFRLTADPGQTIRPLPCVNAAYNLERMQIDYRDISIG